MPFNMKKAYEAGIYRLMIVCRGVLARELLALPRWRNAPRTAPVSVSGASDRRIAMNADQSGAHAAPPASSQRAHRGRA
jgi:hypothetical protein